MDKLIASDGSINFIENDVMEHRYVRRNREKASFYVSSATGCNKLCKFCHLTATKQFRTQYYTNDDILYQVENLWKHYLEQEIADRLNINFMARGEPLSNINLDADYLYDHINRIVDIPFRMNISTIIPTDIKNDLLYSDKTYIYYSLYSENKTFREHWMTNAMDIDNAKVLLKKVKNPLTLHFALIKNQNDSFEDISNMIKSFLDIDYKVSLIRYNPYSIHEGEEADYPTTYNMVKQMFINSGINCKIIERVGYSAKASCGMFVE